MQELFPLACGLLLGGILGYVRPAVRPSLGGALAVLLGVLATVVTGEFRLSWGYVLVDIPLVACAAVLGLMVVRRLRTRPLRTS
jgi:uncharacterized membrane protein (UPF0136 family)